ncbi:MAG: SDR family oxidoreductase [Bacteroidota bacterium]|nr:SDR family oxidoreductase [Bacteroidota bacterium]
MTKKKIFIAGGSGFVGAVLSPYLHHAGYDITIADTCWFGEHAPRGITLMKLDLFDLKIEQLKGYDTVIFLAGLSNDPMAEYAPSGNFIYNTALPAYIGFIAREAGVKRVIFASSCSVYGYTHNKTYTEIDEAVCNYPYGVSKLQGECVLTSLQTEDFSVICLRQGTISGYSPRMRLDLAINTMMKNAMLKHEITVSNPKIWRPILGLKDLCKAYHLAIDSKPSINGIFNIASFNNTIGELAQQLKNILEKKYNTLIKITDKNIQDYRNYKVSWQKAQEVLWYNPAQTEADIIEDLLENIDKFNDFKNPKYYNIEVFKNIKTKY